MVRTLLRIDAVLAVVLVAVWVWVRVIDPPQPAINAMVAPPSNELAAMLVERGISIEADYEVRVFTREPVDDQAMTAVLDQYGPFSVYDRDDGEKIGTYTAGGLSSLR